MKKLFAVLGLVLLTASLGVGQTLFNYANSAGKFYAPAYGDYTFKSLSTVAAGSATMNVSVSGVADANAGCFVDTAGFGAKKFTPLFVGDSLLIQDANSETVTVTAATSTAGSCSFTASFSNAHNPGALVKSASVGLYEAINDLVNLGGGTVRVDARWYSKGGTKAIIAAALPYSGIQVEDTSGSGIQFWNLQQTAAALLPAPATLTAVTALPSATPVGAYGTGTYHLCIAYVDPAGQEGPCSADFSEAGLATGSFIFSAPAASTGAVGYTIYISLTGGTYSLAYQVPLTSSVCTLTKIESVTPACAVVNSTYGQSGAAATVTAITVSTSPVDMQLGGVSGTFLTGNPNGRTTYGYVQSSHSNSAGIPTVNFAFTAGGIGSATPIAIGTVNFPAGVLNQVGFTIRVCGKELNTDVNSSVQNINIFWDAPGSNVAGSPVQLSGLKATGTGTAAAYAGNFCKLFTTSVAGAGATAGSIMPGQDSFSYYLVSTGNIVGNGSDTLAAAVASLNLAGTAGFGQRLSIVHTNTTGNATPQLQSLTIEVL